MRDYHNAKAMAQTLRDDLSGKSLTLSHSECLELVAHMLGLRDWNVLAAKIESEHCSQPSEAMSVEGKATAPRFCAFCGKTEHEVAKLIAGSAAFICGGCVELCHDVIFIDNDPGYAQLTRDSLVSKSVEEMVLLKARIGRSLATAQRIRDAISPYTQNATSTSDTKLSPQVASFLRKSAEERYSFVSQIESRIASLERGLAIVDELLGNSTLARKSGD